jgi:hypothetical protein
MKLPAFGVWKTPLKRGSGNEHAGHFDGTLFYRFDPVETALTASLGLMMPRTRFLSSCSPVVTPLLAAALDEHKSCLIVQAEIGPDGRTVFGIIEPHAIRALPADKLGLVLPLAQNQMR